MKKPARHKNPIIQFFFPKNFMEEFMYARFKTETRAVERAIESQKNMQLGMQKVKEHKRGVFFFNLFNRLPIVGYVIFTNIGKKEKQKKEKEMAKSGKNGEDITKRRKGFLYLGVVCVVISVIGITVLAVIN